MKLLLDLVRPIAEYLNCDPKGVLYPILVSIPVFIFFVFAAGCYWANYRQGRNN